MRRLLHDCLPIEQIALPLVNRNIVELERMFLSGVEMVPQIVGNEHSRIAKTSIIEIRERVRMATGIEQHIQTNIIRLKPTELRKGRDRWNK